MRGKVAGETVKMYWVVTFVDTGNGKPITAWFDDRDTMREYISKYEYVDKPIKVCEKGELSIMFADTLVEETEHVLSSMLEGR